MSGAKHILILGIMAGFFSCANPSQSPFAAASLSPELQSTKPEKPEYEDREEVSVNLDGRLELNFQVEDLWTDDAYLQQIHHDTVYLMLGLVEQISGHHFEIILLDPDITHVSVFQRYETSLTLMDEGPHVDLTDWLHYTSPWEELSVEGNKFSSAVYKSEHYRQFPEVTTKEIVSAVASRVKSNEKWVELAKNCQSPQAYPCGISISRYFLKIQTRGNKEQLRENVVVFEVPMGC